MKQIAAAFFCCVTFLAVAYSQLVVPTEHGFISKYVVVQRWTNVEFGMTIGFIFPQLTNPNNTQRDKIGQFMRTNGGAVYWHDDKPIYTVYVYFQKVNNKDTADQKCIAILPGLEKLIMEGVK